MEISHVTKGFGAVLAVDDFSLQIHQGEVVSLLGPSGCGKTTTLNMIAGFLDPDAGDIAVGGQSIVGVPPHRRNAGMVFQSYALFPHMTVFDNIAFGLRMRKVSKDEVRDRVKGALRLVRLEGMEARLPKQLSGGQQQRVALARALVIKPAVLLLDEPLSNLDAKLRAEMQVELREIQRATGVTTVFVTHDQEEALTLSHRLAVMNRGKVEQVGTPSEIYEKPKTVFVAQFIGNSNLLAGVVEATDRDSAVVLTKEGFKIVVATQEQWSQGEEVVVMARPERTRLSRQSTGAANSLRARLRDVTYLGAERRYYLRVADREMVVISQGESVGLGASPGDEVFVEWATADALLLRGEPNAALAGASVGAPSHAERKLPVQPAVEQA